MTAPTMGSREWLMLLVLSVLWGGSFFFSKVALDELPPLTVVLARVAVAALALHVVVLAGGMRMPRERATWGAFAGMGLLNNLIPFSLIFWGQTQISSGLASILNATTPLMTVVLAHLLTRDERLRASRTMGVLLGLAGVAVMLGPDAVDGLNPGLLGQLAVLGAALSYGFASIYGRRFRGTPPLITACGQVTATTLLMAPIATAVDQPWTQSAPSWTTLAALAGLGLLSTALAYLLYFRILAAAGATNVVLVTLLIPVSALLLGTTLLDEEIGPGELIGMAGIAFGLAAIDGRLLRWLLARASPATLVRARATRPPR